jgi:hypothetical protein
MSEYRFTDGNLLVLYAIYRGKSLDGGNSLPDYIQERVKVGLETYSMIMKSRPDKNKTMVMIVGDPGPSEIIKEILVKGGVKREIIAIDSESKNIGQTVDYIHSIISKKPNPPFIYFVASVWLHDTYNTTFISKMKNIKTQFYGALDHRPVHEVEQEKTYDVPKKGGEYYKRRLTNKAVDIVLNIIFPD